MTVKIMVSIGQKLSQQRKANNVTQKHIAEHLGIHPNSYQMFEYDKAKPSYENLVKLCELFNVSADYILGLTDVPRPLQGEPLSNYDEVVLVKSPKQQSSDSDWRAYRDVLEWLDNTVRHWDCVRINNS